MLRDSKLRLLSEDHTLVNELIAEGIITPEEGRIHPQRNIILKALGSVSHLDPYVSRIDLKKGDILLLCSDGLHGYMADEEITRILTKYSVEQAGRKLIDHALDLGGADNITIVLISI